MAVLPIYLEVEDVAVGPVLIALRKMPGIIKMNLDIGTGAPPPASAARRDPNAGTISEQVVAMLMQNGVSSVSISEIMQRTGSTKASVYTALYQLKKKKVITSPDKGMYALTEKARRSLMGEPKLLAAPKQTKSAAVVQHTPPQVNGHAKITKGPGGRASPGSGRQLLIEALLESPRASMDIGKFLGAKGMSSKSISGVVDRAKRDELIKKSTSDNKYHLTAKGKHEAATATPTTGAE